MVLPETTYQLAHYRKNSASLLLTLETDVSSKMLSIRDTQLYDCKNLVKKKKKLYRKAKKIKLNIDWVKNIEL